VRIITLLTLLTLFTFNSLAIAKTSNLSLDKNQVADFLFLTDRENGKPFKKKYFAEIGPAGQTLGYKPVTSFLITRHPISCEYFPRVLAIASWPGDWQQRQTLFKELLKIRPDISSRRYDIWSTFNMLNYEIKEDIDLEFNPKKIYVFSAYWMKDAINYSSFANEMLQKIKQAGGAAKVKFNGGQTLFGYTEAPDLTIITEWKSQNDFDTYYDSIQSKQKQTTKYSSELYLDIRE
jgi:hypothetical protein